MLEPGQRVLAAFSGGADSTALVLILDSLGYDVVAGHVDHGIRPNAAEEARRCREVAAMLRIPLQVARLAGVGRGEAAARQARYAALMDMAAAARTPSIATGHTLDDDAETVLLRLGRGGYPLGIPPRRGKVVRPLLRLRRRQTAEVCAAAGIEPIYDPTNDDDSIARNRIRHRLLPGLGDAGILALAAVADSSRLAKQRRDTAVGAMLAALCRPGEPLRLDRVALASLPLNVQTAVLRRALQELGVEPTWRLLRDLVAKVVPTTGARLHLPGGLAAWCEPSEIVAGTLPPPLPVRAPSLLVVPGRTSLASWGPRGLEVVVEEVAPPARPRTSVWEALLDRDACLRAGPLAVRSRLPGDRYRPLGAPGERKLQDVLVDLKVPRAERDLVPILTAGDQIAWVGGHRIAERFRLGAGSTAALRVRFL